MQKHRNNGLHFGVNSSDWYRASHIPIWKDWIFTTLHGSLFMPLWKFMVRYIHNFQRRTDVMSYHRCSDTECLSRPGLLHWGVLFPHLATLLCISLAMTSHFYFKHLLCMVLKRCGGNTRENAGTDVCIFMLWFKWGVTATITIQWMRNDDMQATPNFPKQLITIEIGSQNDTPWFKQEVTDK